MIRVFGFVLTFFLSHCCLGAVYDERYFDLDEPADSVGKGKLVSMSKDALMSFDYVEKRADYFMFKLKNLTFGEYSDNVLYIAPVLIGKVEVNIHGFRLYYDHLNDQKSGFKYKVKF